MAKILAFSGSAREGSYNQKLVKIAALGAEEVGVEVVVVNLRDFPMPMYDEDLEAREGLPEHARRFKKLLIESDGLLIASPEYNSAFSPLLKNALDWVSRSGGEDEPMLHAFNGKVAGIMAASPGALGGMRGLVFLRMLLENIRVMVVPQQRAIRSAHEAFDENGNLINDIDQKAVAEIGAIVATMVQKLKD